MNREPSFHLPFAPADRAAARRLEAERLSVQDAVLLAARRRATQLRNAAIDQAWRAVWQSLTGLLAARSVRAERDAGRRSRHAAATPFRAWRIGGMGRGAASGPTRRRIATEA
jgi:hypothetical protein